jgi:hypothetical protein
MECDRIRRGAALAPTILPHPMSLAGDSKADETTGRREDHHPAT